MNCEFRYLVATATSPRFGAATEKRNNTDLTHLSDDESTEPKFADPNNMGLSDDELLELILADQARFLAVLAKPIPIAELLPQAAATRLCRSRGQRGYGFGYLSISAGFGESFLSHHAAGDSFRQRA